MTEVRQFDTNRVFTNLILAAPLTLLVPVGYALLGMIWDIELSWTAILFGALGWLIALALRAPVAIATKQMVDSQNVLQRVIVASSGFLEEPARLIVLLLVGRDFEIAYSIGLGWAAIEVVYTVINSFVIGSLTVRTDEKSKEALKQLDEMGVLSETAPFLGIFERITSSAVHIGFAMLIAVWPAFVVAAIPIHSATNMGILAVNMRSKIGAQLMLALIATVIFVGGLAGFEVL